MQLKVFLLLLLTRIQRAIFSNFFSNGLDWTFPSRSLRSWARARCLCKYFPVSAAASQFQLFNFTRVLQTGCNSFLKILEFKLIKVLKWWVLTKLKWLNNVNIFKQLIQWIKNIHRFFPPNIWSSSFLSFCLPLFHFDLPRKISNIKPNKQTDRQTGQKMNYWGKWDRDISIFDYFLIDFPLPSERIYCIAEKQRNHEIDFTMIKCIEESDLSSWSLLYEVWLVILLLWWRAEATDEMVLHLSINKFPVPR